MATPDWLRALLRVPCVIYSRVPTGEDEYGDVTYTEDSAPGTCYLQPVSQDEIQNGTALVGSYLLHLGDEWAGKLDGFARVEVAGMSLEAEGPPAVFPDIDRGGVHHVEQIVVHSTA
jgi:hypothetical protein